MCSKHGETFAKLVLAFIFKYIKDARCKMFTRNPVSTDESDMVGGYQSICPALSARQNGCGNGDD